MENETGTQERAGSDGSKEGGVNADSLDCLVGRCGDCRNYSDGECYKIFDAVSVHCDCEGPLDGMRVDKDFVCKFYTPNTHVEHRPACVPTDGSK